MNRQLLEDIKEELEKALKALEQDGQNRNWMAYYSIEDAIERLKAYEKN